MVHDVALCLAVLPGAGVLSLVALGASTGLVPALVSAEILARTRAGGEATAHLSTDVS